MINRWTDLTPEYALPKPQQAGHFRICPHLLEKLTFPHDPADPILKTAKLMFLASVKSTAELRNRSILVRPAQIVSVYETGAAWNIRRKPPEYPNGIVVDVSIAFSY